MWLDADCRFERILNCANVLRSHPAGQCPAIRLDESPQRLDDFRRGLVASEDDFRNPGASHPIGVNANRWLFLGDPLEFLPLHAAKCLAKIDER
jgi:hypothetical protein